MILQSDTPGKAGTVARTFEGGGKTDWFLPSEDELNALCKWAWNDTVNMICNNNGEGTGLSLTNGGFTDYNYWSSSESAANRARVRSFFNGSQSQTTHQLKLEGGVVRPVRAF
jgi:hypothetical protein